MQDKEFEKAYDRMLEAEGQLYLTAIRDIMNTIRSNGSVFKRAEFQTRVKIVNKSEDFVDKLNVPVDYSSALLESTSGWMSTMPALTIPEMSNSLHAKYAVVSDIEGLSAGGVSKTGVLDVPIDSCLYVKEGVELMRVKLDGVQSFEHTTIGKHSSDLGSANFTTGEDLAKIYKWDRRKIGDLSASERATLVDVAKMSRGKSCHLPRLVKGALYYLEACLLGSVAFVPEDVARTQWVGYDHTDILQAARAADASYMHLPAGDDPAMNLFLVALTKEYPVNRKLTGDTMFRGRCVTIPGDGKVTFALGRSASVQPTVGINATAKKMWAWMVEYSSAVGIESQLGLAMVCASAMVFGDKWPSMHLPATRSYSDLVLPTLAPRPSADRHLRAPNPDLSLVSACVLAHRVILMAKELRAVEVTSTVGTHAVRELWAEMAGNMQGRKRIYGGFQRSFFDTAFGVVDVLDPLKCNWEHVEKYDTVKFGSVWWSATRNTDCRVLANGLAARMCSTYHTSREKMQQTMVSVSGPSYAARAALGYIKVNRPVSASMKLLNPIYDEAMWREHAAETADQVTSVVGLGVGIVRSKKTRRLKNMSRGVVIPEHFDPTDEGRPDEGDERPYDDEEEGFYEPADDQAHYTRPESDDEEEVRAPTPTYASSVRSGSPTYSPGSPATRSMAENQEWFDAYIKQSGSIRYPDIGTGPRSPGGEQQYVPLKPTNTFVSSKTDTIEAYNKRIQDALDASMEDGNATQQPVPQAVVTPLPASRPASPMSMTQAIDQVTLELNNKLAKQQAALDRIRSRSQEQKARMDDANASFAAAVKRRLRKDPVGIFFLPRGSGMVVTSDMADAMLLFAEACDTICQIAGEHKSRKNGKPRSDSLSWEWQLLRVQYRWSSSLSDDMLTQALRRAITSYKDLGVAIGRVNQRVLPFKYDALDVMSFPGSERLLWMGYADYEYANDDDGTDLALVLGTLGGIGWSPSKPYGGTKNAFLERTNISIQLLKMFHKNIKAVLGSKE